MKKKQLEIIRTFDRHLRGPCKYLSAGRIRETKDVVLEKRQVSYYATSTYSTVVLGVRRLGSFEHWYFWKYDAFSKMWWIYVIFWPRLLKNGSSSIFGGKGHYLPLSVRSKENIVLVMCFFSWFIAIRQWTAMHIITILHSPLLVTICVLLSIWHRRAETFLMGDTWPLHF